MSWDEAFSLRYDEWSAKMTADVPFYIELARQADGSIVELAVGNGRVAVPVATAIGRTVIGVDVSPSMLEQNEWLGLLDVAGLTLESLHGGFDGEPFDSDSREYVFVARR